MSDGQQRCHMNSGRSESGTRAWQLPNTHRRAEARLRSKGRFAPVHIILEGYETWYGYYQPHGIDTAWVLKSCTGPQSLKFARHANDYWHKSTVFLATGEIDACLNRMPASRRHFTFFSVLRLCTLSFEIPRTRSIKARSVNAQRDVFRLDAHALASWASCIRSSGQNASDQWAPEVLCAMRSPCRRPARRTRSQILVDGVLLRLLQKCFALCSCSGSLQQLGSTNCSKAMKSTSSSSGS